MSARERPRRNARERKRGTHTGREKGKYTAKARRNSSEKDGVREKDIAPNPVDRSSSQVERKREGKRKEGSR